VTYSDYGQLDLNAALYDVAVVGFLPNEMPMDPNKKLSILNDFMSGLFDKFVPLKTKRCVDSDTPFCWP
jgi:hypothetical protein